MYAYIYCWQGTKLLRIWFYKSYNTRGNSVTAQLFSYSVMLDGDQLGLFQRLYKFAYNLSKIDPLATYFHVM